MYRYYIIILSDGTPLLRYNRPMLSSLEHSILQTVCYADVFDFTLTPHEIFRFLITNKHYQLGDITSAIAHISELRIHNGFVYLRGRKKLVELRKNLRHISTQKMKEAHAAAKLLRWIPMISAMFVTGGLAVGNIHDDDDIDFMIVTKPGWLWTTRCCVVCVSSLFGRYRFRSTMHVKNHWCFNLWLDETVLTISSLYRNIYTAHEVVQAKSVLDRSNITQRFLAANTWVKTFLANATDWEIMKNATQTSKNIGAVNPIEICCYALQQWHMRRIRTRERIGLLFAFFHPRDTSGIVMKKFKERMKAYEA